MKNKGFQKYFSSLSTLSSSILAVIAGLVVGFIVLMICDPNNGVSGFITMVTAGIGQGGMKAVGNIFYYAVPIMMTGLGISVAFKAGVFNIGGPGQFIVGAFAAIYTAIKWEWLPGALRWIVPIIMAGIAGALWALIPGLLKAYRNVNIVISTIMMNYIGMYVVNFLVKETVYNVTTGASQNIPTAAQLPTLGLDKVFAGSGMNISIIIAIVLCVIVYILINKTTFGYELKACGMNPDACKYAGIREKRSIVMSIMLSGAIVAIGGALLYLASTGRHIRVMDTQASEGFTGIAVAVLANSHPLGVILSSLFIGFLTVGGQYIQSYGFVNEIVDIITAVVIYFAAFTLIVKNFFEKRARKKYARENAEKGLSDDIDKKPPLSGETAEKGSDKKEVIE